MLACKIGENKSEERNYYGGWKGTRMHSELPKVLHKILEVPMLGMVINSLKKSGTERNCMCSWL